MGEVGPPAKPVIPLHLPLFAPEVLNGLPARNALQAVALISGMNATVALMGPSVRQVTSDGNPSQHDLSHTTAL
jgi:hypothetical protein